MVADVTTRESHSDANKSARKGTRASRKPAKQGTKHAGNGKSVAKPATRAVKAARPAAAPAKATRRGARPAQTPAAGVALSKAGFVRTQPLTLPAKDVVTAAARLGLRMTPDYVHKVRSSTKARDRLAGISVASPRTKSLVADQGAAGASNEAPRTNGEATFRKLVLELGLDRAKRLLADVERRIVPLLR